MEKLDIEIEELKVWKYYALEHFLDVLNGDKSVEEAREDILSFRNSEYYTGTNPEYKILPNDK